MKRIILFLISVIVFSVPMYARHKHYKVSRRIDKANQSTNKLVEELSKKNSLQLVVNSLAECESFSWNGIGEYGFISRQYAIAKLLKEMANVAQLDSLARDGQTPLVKATAFALLCSRSDSVSSETILPIILLNLPDTSKFKVDNFCFRVQCSLSSFTTTVAFGACGGRILTDTDSAYVDSLIVNTDSLSFNGRFMTILKNNVAKEKYYDRVHTIYEKYGKAELLPYIAIYQRDEDIPLILEAFENQTNEAMEAITYWPHPSYREKVYEYGMTKASDSYYNYQTLNNMFMYVLHQEPEWAISCMDEVMSKCAQNCSYIWFRDALYTAYLIYRWKGDMTFQRSENTPYMAYLVDKNDIYKEEIIKWLHYKEFKKEDCSFGGDIDRDIDRMDLQKRAERYMRFRIKVVE